MENTGGDRIDGAIGDNAQQAAVGKDINTSAASGNVTNIHLSPGWTPDLPHGQDRGRLMPDVERELRENIAKLTDGLHENSKVVIRLEATMDKNNTLALQQIDILKMSFQALEELAKKTDATVASTLSGINIVSPSRQPLLPAWAIVFGIICLSLITIGVIAVVYFVAQGFG